MALQVINTTITSATAAVSLGTVDSLLIGRDGLAASTGGNFGVVGTGSAHWVRIEGGAVGFSGVSLGDNAGLDNGQRVLIADTGFVSGTTNGINLVSYASSVVNMGTIEGQYGVVFNGTNGSSTSLLRNEGTIYGSIHGVSTGAGEALNILNSGVITGEVFGVFGSVLTDTLRNKGEIVGVVDLRSGNDSYDGRGGSVDGLIQGGTGNDTFRVGLGFDSIDGGLDVDTLDFRLGGGVTVALDGSFVGTGAALGDVYANIENLQGSLTGNDVLGGSAVANVINGYGGKDRILAGAGDDSVAGGVGIDTMTGGLGNDRFYFNSLADGGDVMTDFRSVAGDDDVFQILGSAFGGGLTPGVLSAAQFQTRDDNQAQDADDRFIYETDTRRLWFDADGNGAGGPVLLATFQVGAVVTNQDIFIA